MFVRKFVVVAGIAAGSLASAASFADAPTRKPACILNEYHVTSVAPLKVGRQIGKISDVHLVGALVHVDAQPGLSAEWLQLRLEQYTQTMKGSQGGMEDCVFDMDIRVQVEDAGSGFDVKIFANNDREAKEVLRRAELQLG